MKSLFLQFSEKLIFIFILFTLVLIIPQKTMCEVLFVQGDKVNLRSNPDQKSEILWEYGNGFPLEVLKSQGDWRMVKDFENDSGWIHKSFLKQGKQVIVKVNKKEDSKINIRSGPGTNNKVVGNAYYGVVFTAINKKGPWLQVRHESGLTGWVKAELLWGL
jgi:SH3-like domain-containing protein